MKTCRTCQEPKPLDAYARGNRCKACDSAAARAWAAANPKRAKANQESWRQRNYDRWTSSAMAATKRREAAIVRATPKWADFEKVLALYREAAALRRLGIDCEIDHIVPLQGVTASGLHCEFNLRIVLSEDNRRKRNKVDPDDHGH